MIDPQLKKIAFFVTAAHLIFLCFATTLFDKPPLPEKKERVLVRTVSLQHSPKKMSPPAELSKEKIVTAEPVKSQKKTDEVKPENNKKIAQKESPPPPNKLSVSKKGKEAVKSEKKVAPSLQPTVAEAQKKNPKLTLEAAKLLKSAQQNLSQIDTSHAKLSPASQRVSSSYTQMSATIGESQGEESYIEEVASLLKILLRLPERGALDLELSLNRKGGVVNMKITNAESEANKHYIEEALKQIQFPGFGKYFVGENQHTFKITLSHSL